jgi:hypothetical protein
MMLSSCTARAWVPYAVQLQRRQKLELGAAGEGLSAVSLIESSCVNGPSGDRANMIACKTAPFFSPGKS